MFEKIFNSRKVTTEGNTIGGLNLFQAIPLFSSIAILFLLLPSCEFEPPDLSIQERKIADSLYRETMKAYRKEMDTVCQQLQDSLIPIYKDSILKMRESEIQKQLERVRNSVQ